LRTCWAFDSASFPGPIHRLSSSPTWCGGLTEGRKIAAFAEAYAKPLAPHDCTGPVTLSVGNHLYGAFGRDFGTADGHRLMVAAISAGQWKGLVNACGIAEGVNALEARTGLDLSDEAQRFEARDAIAEMIEAWFAARTREQAERALDAHKATWGRYSSVSELLTNDPRVNAATNPVFERIDTPGIGPHIAAGAAVRAPALAREPTGPAALLGTHTDEVLHEVLKLDGMPSAGCTTQAWWPGQSVIRP
jgi:2-methylfumaryl-CoA isomerase